MGAVQGFLATYGIGGVIGAVVGWLLFNAGAAPDPSCVVPGSSACMEMWNLPFLAFVLVFAAVGGAINMAAKFGMGKL